MRPKAQLSNPSEDQFLRLRIAIRGAVQGVGFRPFIYRLATGLGLSGWVNNSPQGVLVEVEGRAQTLRSFLLRVETEKPPRSFIQSLEPSFLDPAGYTSFEIRTSCEAGEKTALVLPDIATCAECLEEIFDPNNRRYLYPFTNCTNCGPRFSIIDSLPYDRANTTMRQFTMCDECRCEYENPLDRRFHAQPNACAACGPRLQLWNRGGEILSSSHQALREAADAVRRGGVVAVKGLGGFHLIVDARDDKAVRGLRERKRREEKPFALMYPSVEMIERECEVSDLERRLLVSVESPIVLLRRKRDAAFQISQQVAPANPYLAIMLPYTPLHHLLMRELGFPVVATSGNLSDEPICTDERDAIERLSGIAELWLVHNRPISRHVDDSIVRVIMGRELVLRRARGYAPLPIHLAQAKSEPPLLAVGAHLKNTVAALTGEDVFVSQHIGDLETAQAFAAFKRVIADLERLYELEPTLVACDAHPNYISTEFACKSNLPVVSIQHHYAHVLACMGENELQGPVVGVSWDGTGYGLDGTIWGGEFLRVPSSSEGACACRDERCDVPFHRVAHLRTFRLPGGEKAVKEPRRVAVGLLYEVFGEDIFSMRELAPVQDFSERERDILKSMLKRGVNCPVTSSAGRLFDGVAAIAGLRQIVRHEGQAAMELEFALDGVETDERYGFEITRSETSTIIVDWEPIVRGVLADVRLRIPVRTISARFHNTLVEAILGVARRVGEERIVLTGGCFQNKYLTERAVRRLREEGFRPYWHQRIPPNDGGIALGQALAAVRAQRKE